MAMVYLWKKTVYLVYRAGRGLFPLDMFCPVEDSPATKQLSRTDQDDIPRTEKEPHTRGDLVQLIAADFRLINENQDDKEIIMSNSSTYKKQIRIKICIQIPKREATKALIGKEHSVWQTPKTSIHAKSNILKWESQSPACSEIPVNRV